MQIPTVESMTAQDHQPHPMDSLHRRSGTDAEEKYSGSMPRIKELALSSILMMMSCSMWEMESGFHYYHTRML